MKLLPSGPLTGLIPAPFTPMTAVGALNPDVIERQAELFSGHGATAVFLTGTTGECHSLSTDERRQVVERWAEIAPSHGLRVATHVGHHCIQTACELARHAQTVGVDVIAAMAPNYYKPRSTSALVAWCQQIAAAAPDTPFLYYDIPSMTGVDFSVVELLDLAQARIPTLQGVKFSRNDFAEFQLCLEWAGDEMDVLFGSDENLLAGLALGAKGAVGSTYNYALPAYQRVITAFNEGRFEDARREQVKTCKLVDILVRYNFTEAGKATMGFLGIDCGPPRPPYLPLTPAQLQKLQCELAELDVFPVRLAPSSTTESQTSCAPLLKS